MKVKIILLLLILTGALMRGQDKYITRNGFISFYSHTAIEDITADNNEVSSIIDTETGDILINVKMTAFHFRKKLMEEHFNENYVASEKYPKAVFKGKILNNSAVNYSELGTYTVEVEGEMTIHGETNRVRSEGTLEKTADGLLAKADFMLNPEDYGIKIPKIVRNNIAEQLEIRVEMKYNPM